MISAALLEQYADLRFGTRSGKPDPAEVLAFEQRVRQLKIG